MITAISFDEFVKMYYIEHRGCYYPKVSVGLSGNGKPPKLSIEEVRKEYEQNANSNLNEN